MPFCYKCGNELTPGKPFCKHCGAQVAPVVQKLSCPNCGTPVNPNEKYCKICGHSQSDTPLETIVTTSQPDKLNTENAAGPATGPVNSDLHTQAAYIAPPPLKKKKRNCLGCFFKSLLVVLLLVIAGVLIIYFATDWLDDTKNDSQSQAIERQADGNNDEMETEIAISKTDAKNLDEAIRQVDDAFANADTNSLKQLLTETSAQKYTGVYHEIQPYMKEYSAAFKNRKLEKSNSFFALYSFTDENGKKYTAEFTLTGDGQWKLVRF